MQKTVAIILALAFLLAGCAQEPQSAPEQPRPRQTRALQLAVREAVSEDAMRGIEAFVETAAAVSEGALQIETVRCADPIAALDAGSDLIFLSNAEVARANGDFLSYASPFYFLNETHLSATLNSGEFVSRIRDKTQSLLGAAPLAAFYGGSGIFLSNESEGLDTVEGWEGIRIFIGEGNDLLSVVLEKFGASVTGRAAETLMDGFLSRSFRTIECDPAELLRLTGDTIGGYPVVAYRTMHAAQIDWLMLSAEAEVSLSAWEQAVLTEAAAAALAANDTAVTAREAAAFEYAESLGVAVYEIDYDAFCEQADEAFLSAVRYRNLWDWDLHSNVRDFARLN